MTLRQTMDAGLGALVEAKGLHVAAGGLLALVGLALGAALACMPNRPHDDLCPCPNCSPRDVSWHVQPMELDHARLLMEAYGRSGDSRALGDHPYRGSFDPVAADRTQMALSALGLDTDRRRFIDRLYLDLREHNPELAAIGLTDPRARQWIVLGALSGVDPDSIEEFVDTYGNGPGSDARDAALAC